MYAHHNVIILDTLLHLIFTYIIMHISVRLEMKAKRDGEKRSKNNMYHQIYYFIQKLLINLHATYLCSSCSALKSQTLVKNRGLLPVSKPNGIP